MGIPSVSPFPRFPIRFGDTKFERRLLAGAFLQMTHVSHRILDGGQCLADKLAADGEVRTFGDVR